ncbi:MAG: urea transporter [Motiliproteus sp.]|jgi:urea transporter
MNRELMALLRGFGQLLFMPHAGVGVLVLLGILINSPLMMFAALTGGLGGTLVGGRVMAAQGVGRC